MSQTIEAEKASPEIHDGEKMPPLSRAPTQSTLAEATDAQANIAPDDLPQVLEAEKPSDPGPPPDGGLKAWIQVVGSFFLFFNCWYVKISRVLLTSLTQVSLL